MTLTEFLLARIAEDEMYARHVWPERFTARQLAECEAKRRIVEGYLEDGTHNAWGGCGDDCEWKAVEWALRWLALPYADHPDYNGEWKP